MGKFATNSVVFLVVLCVLRATFALAWTGELESVVDKRQLVVENIPPSNDKSKNAFCWIEAKELCEEREEETEQRFDADKKIKNLFSSTGFRNFWNNQRGLLKKYHTFLKLLPIALVFSSNEPIFLLHRNIRI